MASLRVIISKFHIAWDLCPINSYRITSKYVKKVIQEESWHEKADKNMKIRVWEALCLFFQNLIVPGICV